MVRLGTVRCVIEDGGEEVLARRDVLFLCDVTNVRTEYVRGLKVPMVEVRRPGSTALVLQLRHGLGAADPQLDSYYRIRAAVGQLDAPCSLRTPRAVRARRRRVADLVTLLLLFPRAADRDTSPDAMRTAVLRIASVAGPDGFAKAVDELLAARSTALDYLGRAKALPAPPPLCHLSPAEVARAAARYARDHTRGFKRSRRWFRLARQLARDSGEMETLARALTGEGIAWKYSGSFPKARRFHRRSAVVASKHGLHEPYAGAHHDLAVLAAETADVALAFRHTRLALRHYPAAHPNRLQVAANMACALIEDGQFEAGLRILSALLGRATDLDLRRQGSANAVRAAGAIGDRTTFEMRWSEAWRLACDSSLPQGRARAFLNLAAGAHSIGEWQKAKVAVDLALDLSRGSEHRVEAYAVALADAVERGMHWVRTPPPAAAVEVAGSMARVVAGGLSGIALVAA